MHRLLDSIATRLALSFGLLVVGSVSLLCLVFYGATIGVLENSLRDQLESTSQRFADSYRERPPQELVDAIGRQLGDGQNSDSEIFLVLDDAGATLAGNLPEWGGTLAPVDTFLLHTVQRSGQPVSIRYIVRQIDEGRWLLVGSDLAAQDSIRQLVLRALSAGVLLSLFLMAAGVIFFRRQIEARIGQIRVAARDIEQGNFGRRITIAGNDEFQRLAMDINQMLDRIEHLMNGVRHVSNSIAHDLRTPLNRVRSQLEEALRRQGTLDALRSAASVAIEDIDDLIQLFNKLLQIAEAEAGMRARFTTTINANDIVRDMVELYDAAAEERGLSLILLEQSASEARGDHDLLASALASLLDNALKYAASGTTVEVSARDEEGHVCIEVRDHGPGVAVDELDLVTERFYRVDASRSQPGSGLGLSIVRAIVTLHGGTLLLDNANPGLRVRLRLPQSTSTDPV
jgi:signal transduction histidine kinase